MNLLNPMRLMGLMGLMGLMRRTELGQGLLPGGGLGAGSTGDPVEVGRESRELGDHPSRRPRVETVENRCRCTKVIGGAAERVGAGQVRARVGGRPAKEDLEQAIQSQRARYRGGQEAGGAKMPHPRHLVSRTVLRGGEGCEHPDRLQQLSADPAERPTPGRLVGLGVRAGDLQRGGHLVEVRQHGGNLRAGRRRLPRSGELWREGDGELVDRSPRGCR